MKMDPIMSSLTCCISLPQLSTFISSHLACSSHLDDPDPTVNALNDSHAATINLQLFDWKSSLWLAHYALGFETFPLLSICDAPMLGFTPPLFLIGYQTEQSGKDVCFFGTTAQALNGACIQRDSKDSVILGLLEMLRDSILWNAPNFSRCSGLHSPANPSG